MKCPGRAGGRLGAGRRRAGRQLELWEGWIRTKNLEIVVQMADDVGLAYDVGNAPCATSEGAKVPNQRGASSGTYAGLRERSRFERLWSAG